MAEISARKVGEQLKELAEESGLSFDSYMDNVWMPPKFAASVPDRYKRIGCEVALALPAGWDEHADSSVVADPGQHPQGYANVLADEELDMETITAYVITVYPSMTGPLRLGLPMGIRT